MRVAVLGAGNGGLASAFDFAQHGHEVALYASPQYGDNLPPVAEAGGLQVDVLMEHEREPFDTPTDDPAVVAAARAHQVVTGRPVEYVGERIVGDANLYVHGSGVPTFYYGPSNETAHGDVEWVSAQRAADAARVYALTALEYCGTSSQ